MTPKSIWNEAQNKPTLVVDDLAQFVDRNMVYTALLRRGVFKWLAVRRSIIALKDEWKVRVRESLENQKRATGPDVNYWRGYRRALEQCRAEVRVLCHSERWQAPDNDSAACRWLSTLTSAERE